MENNDILQKNIEQLIDAKMELNYLINELDELIDSCDSVLNS